MVNHKNNLLCMSYKIYNIPNKKSIQILYLNYNKIDYIYTPNLFSLSYIYISLYFTHFFIIFIIFIIIYQIYK